MSFISQRIDELGQVVFDLLASQIHKKSNFSLIFTKRCIANSLYDMAPKIKSGLISVDAKKMLQEGKITRGRLCHEHPFPRTRTSLNIIDYFDESFGKSANNVIISGIKEHIERGSRVHMVLTLENQRLVPFQQNYSLSEEQIYAMANVVLVEDDLNNNKRTYRLNNKKYYSIPDISKDTGFTKYKVKKMIDSGEIVIEKK